MENVIINKNCKENMLHNIQAIVRVFMNPL